MNVNKAKEFISSVDNKIWRRKKVYSLNSCVLIRITELKNFLIPLHLAFDLS